MQQKVPDLNTWENIVYNTQRGKAWPFPQADLILVWPNRYAPVWCDESGIASPKDCARWLQRAYNLLTGWAGVNPALYYVTRGRNKGERNRLVFIHNPHASTANWNHDPTNESRRMINWVTEGDHIGSCDWLGMLIHEIAHDTLKVMDWFRPYSAVWEEAFADYLRHQGTVAMGMKRAADQRWREDIQNAGRDDRYRYGAKMLIEFERDRKLNGPGHLLQVLNGRNSSDVLGVPAWERR
jgi:hypothetical protein